MVVQEVHADGARLAELAALVDFGLLELPPITRVPFSDAARAHAMAEQRGRRDRVVLVPDREVCSTTGPSDRRRDGSAPERPGAATNVSFRPVGKPRLR